MAKLALLYNQQINEAYLNEITDGREDIKSFIRELTDIFEEYNERMLGIEDGYLVEQGQLAGELSTRQITRLFRAASAFSKGENYKKGMLTKMGEKGAAAKEAVGKMVNAVKTAAKSLQNTEPVQMFDMKVADVLNKWKQKLGEDHKAVKLAQQLGEYGKNNPKKTAFIIGALTALTSALGTPAFGMAAGTALRTAMGLAKGERASTAVGRGAATAAIGAAAGAVAGGLADYISGDEAIQSVEAQAQEAGVPAAQQADPEIMKQNLGSLSHTTAPEDLGNNWQQYVDKFYQGNEAAAERGWQHMIDDDMGRNLIANRLARIGVQL